MTSPTTENQVETNKNVDKELNFRALEAKYQRELEKERSARMEAERQVQEAQTKRIDVQDDEGDNEPYVDHKKLDRKLSNFEKTMEKKIDQRAEEKARSMMVAEKRETFLRNNADFYEVLQHAEKLAQRDPELAESILEMPDTFERQKLVYKNIKALGIHKPLAPVQSIQDKVDANRRSPYYQPSGVGAAPYANAGDFSPSGQKNAYEKMQALKKALRI